MKEMMQSWKTQLHEFDIFFRWRNIPNIWSPLWQIGHRNLLLKSRKLTDCCIVCN